eukprot:10205360-Karenia_brevis.AAC.1
MLLTTFSQRCVAPPDQRPIPRWVSKSGTFKKILKDAVDKAQLHKLGLLARHRCYKKLIRRSASIARNMLVNEASLTQARDTMLATLARVVVGNNVDLAKQLIAVSKLAQVHVGVKDDAVFLHDPTQFALEVDKSRNSSLKEQIDAE